MSRSQDMPEVDFTKDEKLKTAYMYSKQVEEKNILRAAYAKRLLRKKRIISSTCVGLVFGIFAFSFLKVKQETTFDDFEEPVRIIKQED